MSEYLEHPNHVSEDQLIDLLNNLLDEKARRVILDHLSACVLCDEHFLLLVRERESLRTQLAPRISSGEIVMPNYTTPPVMPLPRRRARWVGAALVVAAAAAFLLPHLFRPEVSGADSYWLPNPDQQTLASLQSPDAVSGLQKALSAYDAHDLERALALMDNVRIPEDNVEADALRGVYKASALVNTNRSEDARRVIDGVDITALPSAWRERANWIRYLSIRGGRHDKDSRALLRQLTDSPGDVGRMAREERSRLAGD